MTNQALKNNTTFSLPTKEIFPILFHEMLTSQGLSAAAYARQLGYSPRTAQHWAKGTNAPPLEVIGDVLIFVIESKKKGGPIRV